MEFRKLIAFGKGSFIVSLPKKWTEKHNLTKGHLIGVEETSDGLILSTKVSDLKKQKKSITIPAENKSITLLTSEIISAYLSNADTIEVLSNDLQKNALTIKNTLRNLAGMEVMEQTATRLVANYLIDKREISIPLIIRRMDNITRAMAQDVLQFFDKKQNVDNIVQRDSDVNRLHFLAYREIRAAIVDPRLANSLQISHLDLHTSKHIVQRIERIADCQKEIARSVDKTNLQKNSLGRLKSLYSDINNYYSSVMKSYYTKDINLAYKIELDICDMIGKCDLFLGDHVHSHTTPKKVPKDKLHHVSISQIVGFLKVMVTNVKYIARSIIDG
jgi:phosphate uptake regulator